VGVLKFLMIGHTARTAQIIALGGMERVLVAMDNHPDDSSGVCYEAVFAMEQMSQGAQRPSSGSRPSARRRACAPRWRPPTCTSHSSSVHLRPCAVVHSGAAAGSAGVGAAAAAAQASEQQQQLLSRLSDVASEPLGLLTPIAGISATPRLPLMDAAIASGVPDMDAHGFVAAEHGAALARNDPHGLDQDETAAISLYTHDSELYPKLNDLLRQRDRTRLKPFLPYLRLLMDARRKLPRHVGTVWRGVKGVDLRDKYLKGSEVYWWAFSSTTKDLSTLQNPNFLGTSGVRTVFNIQVKRRKSCWK